MNTFRTRVLFVPPRTFEERKPFWGGHEDYDQGMVASGLGECGEDCECASCAPLRGLGDYTETRDPRTGAVTTEYKSGGVDPAMGSKMVFEALSDLFTGRREKESAREAAERLARIQAGTDIAQAQARAVAAERWTAFAPWAVMGLGVVAVGVILLKASKK